MSVEKKIRKLMTLYERNITSVLAQFPSQQIANVIDGYVMLSFASFATNIFSRFESIFQSSAQFSIMLKFLLNSRHAATLQKRSDRDNFFVQTQGIIQLVQRYRNGIRGRMKAAVHELLRQYHDVESQFLLGTHLAVVFSIIISTTLRRIVRLCITTYVCRSL